MTSMKCAVCEGPSISELGDYASFETHIRFKNDAGGWFKRDTTLKPTKARVCRDCGYVMLFVSSSELSRLGGAAGD